MTTAHTANSDAFVLHCKAWAKRLKERPIVCPTGSAFYREQLLREAHENALRVLGEMGAVDALDLLPKWREMGRLLARLDADLRHARECENRWPAELEGSEA
ncbi:hypothetical protein C5E45_28305 [Nocardia nova]|uniref:Uncharacterized protein n=1 Tax=Nocardia nova TaxID=37330 RepID=A0A2S6AI79_9NOCA|nr:hypothetical protein [Nocardia nova]PPJ24151.1 hypothetical protein C5E41_22895 [Nocardia nova]PPJ34921.1 hypothetical protein C5E45_28305 [Nocardia nova]